MKDIRLWYGFGIAAISLLTVVMSPVIAEAAEDGAGTAEVSAEGPGSGPGFSPEIIAEGCTAYVSEGSADVYVSMDSYDILKAAIPGEYFEILGDEGGGWMEIGVGDGVGYVSDQQVMVCSPEEWEEMQQDEAVLAQIQAAEAQLAAEAEAELRQQVVNFALQFLGCSYVYGGTDPHSGVDCSGFARYVMLNAAGVSLERSSSSQAGQGVSVGADQMQPGDLVFYGNGSGINHVAIYIGAGQVVHASTEKTGVKISAWTYRTPLRIVNVLG